MKEVIEERNKHRAEVKRLKRILTKTEKEILTLSPQKKVEEKGKERRIDMKHTNEQGTNTEEDQQPTEPLPEIPQKDPPSQYREGEPPLLIVHIDNSNRHRIYKGDRGLITNDNGTLTRTYQFEEWMRNPRLQLEKRYRIAPSQPEEYLKVEGHPKPSDLDLEWSYEEEWFYFYIKKEKDEEKPEDAKKVRVEKYVDEKGIIRKALCYAEDENELKIWYHFEDIKEAFPGWNPPETSLYYNSRRFLGQRKREAGGEKTPKPLQKTEGSNKTPNPTQKKEKEAEAKKEEKPRAKREIEWNKERKREYEEWDKAQSTNYREKDHHTQYKPLVKPRPNHGPVQAQVRAQTQYKAQAQYRAYPTHTRGAINNSRRIIAEGRRGPPTHRTWSERSMKRERSPNLDEDRYGSIRGRGVRMRVDRSYSSRGRPSHVRTYR